MTQSLRRADVSALAPQSLQEIFDSSDLQHTLASLSQRSVILFGAKRCRACRSLLLFLKQVAADRPSTSFYFVLQSHTTADAFQAHAITTTPTLLLFAPTGELLESLTDVPNMKGALEGSWCS